MFPVKISNTYLGRIYLRSEEEGKNFIIDYSSFRSKIYKFYAEKTIATFNISLSSKTLRDIKINIDKTKDIETKLKNQATLERTERRAALPQNRVPLIGNPLVGNPMIPKMAPGQGPIMGPAGFVTIPQMAPLPKTILGGPPMMQQQTIKTRIANIIRDKQRIF